MVSNVVEHQMSLVNSPAVSVSTAVSGRSVATGGSVSTAGMMSRLNERNENVSATR